MGTIKSDSLFGKIREAVQRLGECSNQQVLKEVAQYIPAISASRAAHHEHNNRTKRCKTVLRKPHHSSSELIALGKRFLVNRALSSLARRGDIVRVRKGVYKPIGLRLYQAS